MTVQPTPSARAPASRMSAFEIEKAAHLLRLRLQMASLKTSSTPSSSIFREASQEAPAAMQTDAVSPPADVKPLPGQLIGLGLPGFGDGSSTSVMSWDEEQPQGSERILAEQPAPSQVKSPQLAQVTQAASTSKAHKPSSSHRRTPSVSRAPEPSLYDAIFGAGTDLKPAGPSATYKHRRTPSATMSSAAEGSSSSSKASYPSPRSLSGMSVRLHIAASSPQLGSPRRTGGSGQFPPRHDPHNHPSWETQEREQRMLLASQAIGAAPDDRSGGSSASHDAFALPTVSPSKRKHDMTASDATSTPPRRAPPAYQLGSDIVLPLGAGISPRRSIHSPRQRTVSQGIDHGLLPNGHPASSLAQDLGLTTGSFRGRMPSTPRQLRRMSSHKGGDEPVGREHTQAETDRVASLLAAMADERTPPGGVPGWNRLKGPSPLSGRGVSTPTKVDPSTPTKTQDQRVGSSAGQTPSNRIEDTDESAALSLLFFAHSPSSASSSRFPGTTPSLLGRSSRPSSSRTDTPDAKMWRPSAPARALFSDDDGASSASPSRNQRDGSLSSASSVDSSGAANNASGSNTESGSESQVSALSVLQESPDLDALSSSDSGMARPHRAGAASSDGGMGAGGIFTPPPSTKKAAGSAAERTAHFERLAARGDASSSGNDSPPMTPPRTYRNREISTASMSHARRDSRGELVLGTPPPRSPSLQPPETPKAMGRFDYSAWVNVSPSPKMTRSRAPSGQFAPFDTPRMREPSSNGAWIESLWGMAGPGPSPQLDRATKAAQALSDVIHTPSRVKRQRVSTPDADAFGGSA